MSGALKARCMSKAPPNVLISSKVLEDSFQSADANELTKVLTSGERHDKACKLSPCMRLIIEGRLASRGQLIPIRSVDRG